MANLERYGSPAKVQRIGNDSVYGTGSDGTVVISSNVSLTRDMYYNNLTIDSGFHLNTNGYKVFVKGTLTLNGNIGVSDTHTVSSSSIAGQAPLSTSTTNSIGGNAFGNTYTASTMSTTLLNDVSTAILGYYIDTSSNTKIVSGGAGGANGVAGTVTPATAGTVTPGSNGFVTPGAAGGASAGYMGAPTTWHGKDNTYGYHVTSSGPGGNHSPGLYGQGQGYPGGPGNQGTSGTNGAAGTTPSVRLAGTISAAVAGSTPPQATAGTAGQGGAVVIVVAKAFAGTGFILAKGKNATAGGPSATGTGAGASATSTNAQGSATGTGATNAAAGAAGTYTPPLNLHHGVNNNVHWNRTVAPAHHVSQPAGALGRTGHQAAKASDTAHGHGSHTSHGATPVHPHNSHGGSNPHTGAAAVSYAAVPAVSGYFHKNSVDHAAGGHLGHDGAVAHPYTYNSAGHHGAHGFADNHYHETDGHQSYVEGFHQSFPEVTVPPYHQPAHASRARYDARHHHTQGVYAQAGTDAHHTAADFVSGLAGPAGLAGSPGTNGHASAATNAHTTAGTNGSTTAGTNGQAGGGGGIIIVTEIAPTGIQTSVSGGSISGSSIASSGTVITVLNA
jgi:hypothetical protein